MKSIAITGTNTDIGKTYVACGIVKELVARNIDTGVFKPFCSGSREDVDNLINAARVNDSVDLVNPFYFDLPLAPFHAIKLTNEKIDLSLCFNSFDILRQRHDLLVVEGAGGILVPITKTSSDIISFLDLFISFNSDIIIVASRELGTINHSWLTAKTCQRAGLNVLGFVFNDAMPIEEKEPATTNPKIISECTGLPTLGIIKHNDTKNSQQFKNIVDRILEQRKND